MYNVPTFSLPIDLLLWDPTYPCVALTAKGPKFLVDLHTHAARPIARLGSSHVLRWRTRACIAKATGGELTGKLRPRLKFEDGTPCACPC